MYELDGISWLIATTKFHSTSYINLLKVQSSLFSLKAFLNTSKPFEVKASTFGCLTIVIANLASPNILILPTNCIEAVNTSCVVL